MNNLILSDNMNNILDKFKEKYGDIIKGINVDSSIVGITVNNGLLMTQKMSDSAKEAFGNDVAIEMAIVIILDKIITCEDYISNMVLVEGKPSEDIKLEPIKNVDEVFRIYSTDSMEFPLDNIVHVSRAFDIAISENLDIDLYVTYGYKPEPTVFNLKYKELSTQLGLIKNTFSEYLTGHMNDAKLIKLVLKRGN